MFFRFVHISEISSLIFPMFSFSMFEYLSFRRFPSDIWYNSFWFLYLHSWYFQFLLSWYVWCLLEITISSSLSIPSIQLIFYYFRFVQRLWYFLYFLYWYFYSLFFSRVCMNHSSSSSYTVHVFHSWSEIMIDFLISYFILKWTLYYEPQRPTSILIISLRVCGIIIEVGLHSSSDPLWSV